MLYFIQVLFILTLSSLVFISYGPRGQIDVGIYFTLTLTVLFLCYLYFLWKAQSISKKNIYILIFITALVCFFSSPATFSNDIYNYIFDGKIPLVYGLSSWAYPPNYFPNDPWLSYVNWPTSVTRYGFVWVALSMAANYIGAKNLLLTEFVFKFFLVILGYGLSLLFINKLSTYLKISVNKALVFFGLNTLIIVEFLINPHTDVLITSLSLMGIYYFLTKRYAFSLMAVITACFVKITVLPLLAVYIFRVFFKNLSEEIYLVLFLLAAYLGALIIISQWSINPWYFSLPFAISTLLTKSKFIRYITISLTIAALSRYLPYMYIGYFDPNNKIRLILFIALMIPFILWIIYRLKLYYFGRLE